MGDAGVVANEVRRGLLATPKRLPAHLLYDMRGSALFELITALPEYYLTRLELELFARYAWEIAGAVGPGPLTVVELGAGSARKSALLIGARLERGERVSYVGIDISPAALHGAAATLSARFPQVEILGVPGRYEAGFSALRSRPGSKLVLFIGSSIGNLGGGEAVALLRQVGESLGPDDALLLGTDLAKDPRVMLPAYDDRAGVTARFNLNVLARINRELGGQFEPGRFRHRVRWNERASRIEMHLESAEEQRVRIERLELEVTFERGETIHTESSVKYTPAMLANMFAGAGLVAERSWTDPRGWFADHLLRRR
ncbi:MAG: L-histidine N(alpha)-methyltransferase [Myxococcaceae bacterium]